MLNLWHTRKTCLVFHEFIDDQKNGLVTKKIGSLVLCAFISIMIEMGWSLECVLITNWSTSTVWSDGIFYTLEPLHWCVPVSTPCKVFTYKYVNPIVFPLHNIGRLLYSNSKPNQGDYYVLKYKPFFNFSRKKYFQSCEFHFFVYSLSLSLSSEFF